MSTQHTPFSIKEYSTSDAGVHANIYTAANHRIAVSLPLDLAAFIVLAVNNHEALVKALKDLMDVVVEREQGNHDLDEELDQAKAAIAQAEGSGSELDLTVEKRS